MYIARENGEGWNKEEYEWKSGSANIAGVSGDVNLNTVAAFTTLFSGVRKGRAHYISIETTGSVYIRLNKSTNDIILVTSTTPFRSDVMAIYAIFATTAAAAVTITVTLI